MCIYLLGCRTEGSSKNLPRKMLETDIHSSTGQNRSKYDTHVRVSVHAVPCLTVHLRTSHRTLLLSSLPTNSIYLFLYSRFITDDFFYILRSVLSLCLTHISFTPPTLPPHSMREGNLKTSLLSFPNVLSVYLSHFLQIPFKSPLISL